MSKSKRQQCKVVISLWPKRVPILTSLHHHRPRWCDIHVVVATSLVMMAGGLPAGWRAAGRRRASVRAVDVRRAAGKHSSRTDSEGRFKAHLRLTVAPGGLLPCRTHLERVGVRSGSFGIQNHRLLARPYFRRGHSRHRPFARYDVARLGSRAVESFIGSSSKPSRISRESCCPIVFVTFCAFWWGSVLFGLI